MAAHSGPDIVNNGLVLHLDAGNPRSYAGTGTTWLDLSGNGNNGTIYAGVTFGNNGFTVDAQGEGILISFPQQSIWTISLWFRKNATGVSLARIAGSGPGIDSGEIAIQGDLINFNSTRGGWTATSGSVANGETTNLVGCFDTVNTTTTNTFFYKNAISIGSSTQAGALETRPTSYMLMARNDFNAEWLPSTLYMVSLYSRILSAEEIRQNFETSRDRYGI